MNAPDVERIRAELLEADVPEADAPQIAENLAHLAATEEIPFHALLAWIHDRPRHGWGPTQFLAWCKRYHLSSAANVTAPAPAAPGGAPQ
jgi:hypothetical protein